MSDQLDLGAAVGIAGLILAIPVGVMPHVLGHRFLQQLEKRKLVKANTTRQQAIRMYNLIKSFHNRTRDRYVYYLQLVGWAVIFAILSSSSVILIVLIKPNMKISSPDPLAVVLIASAFVFALFAVLLMVGLYETSRQLDRFDAYKAELEQQWGPIDHENLEARLGQQA